MIAKAVIGASYGDEGKGRTVDWLAAPHGPDALVVRSNGGAQAAHTVVRDGKRHVFHHIGSGALVGARTHLSRFMVSHPIIFAQEAATLKAIGANLAITADPRGYVSTPWDMMVNQALELSRDVGRHGSCGLGFGETVGRSEETEFGLTVGDLHADGLEAKLRRIAAEWLQERVLAAGLPPDFGPLAYAQSKEVLGTFIAQCDAFRQVVGIRDDGQLVGEEVLIFEGAQGLLLDQNGANFPFVTRSNTGLSNVAAIAAEAGIAGVEPIYITRSYLTRHGRGPMDDERDISRWFATDDPTNTPNAWQESLRFGLLDLDRLGERVRSDMASADGGVRPTLVITCLDQAKSQMAWIESGAVREGSTAKFAERLSAVVGIPVSAQFSAPDNQSAEALEPA